MISFSGCGCRDRNPINHFLPGPMDGSRDRCFERSAELNENHAFRSAGAVVVTWSPINRTNERSQPISRVLSRTIIHLGSASPQTSSDLPGNLHGPCVQLSLRVPLFGLAPSGVYRAVECCHRRGALLPHHFTLTGTLARCLGGLFSVALSVNSRSPGVTWRSALGARTFLYTHFCAQRLPG